jgi:hypothetical protein
VYGTTALLLTYSVCREFFDRTLSVWSTLSVWLAGTLVFYMYSHPLMSHANDAFAFALLVYTWIRTRKSPGMAGPLLRGAAAGLAALIRQSNAVFVLLLLAEYGVDGLRSCLDRRRPAALLRALTRMALTGGAWWVTFAPQVFTWRIVFGEWIVVNPYAGGAGVGFDLLRPHILQVLLSTNRGLFTWTPLMLPAAMGLALLWKSERRLTLLLAGWFLAQLYIVASWGAWSGSVAFGQRFFTNMLPVFALGLAALLRAVSTRFGMRCVEAALCLFIVWNGLLIARYAIGDVPRSGQVPLRQLLLGQFTVVPRQLGRIVRAVLTRE